MGRGRERWWLQRKKEREREGPGTRVISGSLRWARKEEFCSKKKKKRDPSDVVVRSK